jgi:hypothetical protein
LYVLSLSREPNLGLCSLLEITDLRIERTLEVSGPLFTGGLKQSVGWAKAAIARPKTGVNALMYLKAFVRCAFRRAHAAGFAVWAV